MSTEPLISDSDNKVTVFETIIQPLLPLLNEEAHRLKGDAQTYKLSLHYFMLSLIYAVIHQVRSIRVLVTDIKTNPDLKKLGFILASPSMYSEAFSRYKPEIFQRIFMMLLEKIEIKDIPEIRELGRFMLFDCSIFPAFKDMFWAAYTSTHQALKMHLAYELNRMIPVQFISTDAKASDREALLALLEAGVTYILDRGYLAFDLFQKIVAHNAFFIMRIRCNTNATVKERLTVSIPKEWASFLSQMSDTLVLFPGDPFKKTYRLVSFVVWGVSYRIATNHLKLKTSEIIMLYAYRWQVELFFRCIKRFFNALHLWSHEPDGIKTQFYIYLIAYVLLIHFKQALIEEKEKAQKETAQSNLPHTSSPQKPSFRKKPTRLPEYGLVSLLGSRLKKLWKISIHWLTCIKNLLFHPLTDENRDTILSTQ